MASRSNQPPIITLDGPAGAGKSTVARRLAERLGYGYLDTGAMYRAVTLIALEDAIPATDGPSLGALAEVIPLRLDGGRTFVGDRDVSSEIRAPEVTAGVSAVSAHGEVRRAMTALQRRVAQDGPLVCEGRDMGTVVFPDAPAKFYLDATPEVRAERRRSDLEHQGVTLAFAEVLALVRERDAKDSARQHAPLRRVPEQIYIDSSSLEVDEVVVQLERLVADRLRVEREQSR